MTVGKTATKIAKSVDVSAESFHSTLKDKQGMHHVCQRFFPKISDS